MNIDSILNNLIKETTDKNYNKLYEILNNTDKDYKGILFELYLKELYEGNNWFVQHKGGSKDGGADLLLIHPDNPNDVVEIIQAKNHKTPLNYDDTRNELRKFEEESSLKYIAKHFKIISLNGFVKSAEEYAKIIDLKNFNLYLADWEYVKELIDNYEPDISKRTLKPQIKLFAHNQIAYEQIHDEWKNHNRVAVVQATGTGKTYIIAKILSDFINKKVLILAPSNHIIDQIKSKSMWTSNNVYFMTYAKLTNFNEEEFNDLKFDLIILDEFHRAGAEEWSKSVQKLLNNNTDHKVLGTSATPIRHSDGKNMIEELFDTKINQEISLAKAIIQNILPEPTYITSLYTLEDEVNILKEKIEKSILTNEEKEKYYTKLQESERDWFKTSGVTQILKKYLSKDKQKFIVFCENKEHLKNMESLILKWFNDTQLYNKVKIYSLYSGYGDFNNDFELKGFKDNDSKKTAKILLTINMLNEGIHITDIDGVMFLRNTYSYIIYYQQLGRSLSVNGKHPLIFDFVNNFANISANNFIKDVEFEKNIYNQKRNEHNLNDKSFNYHIIDESKNILTVLNDIENKTNNWDIQYNNLIKYYIENGHSDVPYEYKENQSLATWVIAQRANYKKDILSINKIKLLEEIEFNFSFYDSWENKYNQCVEFYNKNGHSDVPNKYKLNPSLASWVVNQRTNYKNNRLSKEQISLLEKIQFTFSFGKSDIWVENYNKVVEYYNENGHINIPNNYDKCPSLPRWIISQRQQFKKNRLSKNQILLLEKIQFKFSINNSWEESYKNAVEYYYNNGCLPSRYESSLGIWVEEQKGKFKNNKLSKEQIDLLAKIGFKPFNKFEIWKETYYKIVEFYKINGHSNIPQRDIQNRSLGVWINTQRMQFKNNKLSKEQIELLEKIEFKFSINKSWEESYEEIVEYYNKNGHFNIKRDTSLGRWAEQQRQKFKNNKLSENQIILLKNINFIF